MEQSLVSNSTGYCMSGRESDSGRNRTSVVVGAGSILHRPLSATGTLRC